MAKQPVDPLRARLMEILEEVSDRLDRLRDHATVPGNSWLAKGELRQVNQELSELENLLDDIKDADSENGF